MKKIFTFLAAVICCVVFSNAATTYQTFYKVQGALYQGIDADYSVGKNLFVPNGGKITFTSFDNKSADWYSAKNYATLKKSGVAAYTTGIFADGNYYSYQIKNYTGYAEQTTKIDYVYGNVSGTSAGIVAGSGKMNMMSMANAYCVCTDHATASNIGKYYVDNRTATTSTSYATNYGTAMQYGTKFTYSSYGALKAYEIIMDNPGEMYIDYVVLPIYGYPKTDGTTTIANMIPEGSKVTLTLYPATLTLNDSTGKYSYSKDSKAIASVSASADNFTKGDKTYNGTIKFVLDQPVLISTDFIARITWDDACDFGLLTDASCLQNYTTWYIFSSVKSTMWTGGGKNASISYHAMFPTLEKKDTLSAINIAAEETDIEIAIKSNIDPASADFSIDFGGADWVSMKKIRYTTDSTYKAAETVYITLTAQANEDKARQATVTLTHHGKSLQYTVNQEAAPEPEPQIVTIYCKMAQDWWKADGAAIAIYSFGGKAGTKTDWPGERMTPVGDDTWSFDVDINKYPSVIFVRVNASGDIADWSAKTQDLTIPTDGKNLFTITSSSAVWGDPGCEGEWSVYVAPAPAIYMKNNWDGGENWTWKEAVIVDDIAVLDSVVFGGTGVNINNFESDANALWFDLAAMKYSGDSIAANDTVRFAFNMTDSTLTATLLAHPYVPVISYDTTMYVAGNFTNWATDMKVLPYTTTFPADSAIEFKQVRIVTTYADAVETAKDTTWYGQEYEGNKMTRDNCTWKLDGNYNVLLTTDAEGEYTFNLNENGEFVVTFPIITPTSIDDMESQNGNVVKFFRDGQLVIIRNNRTYNAVGVEIK